MRLQPTYLEHDLTLHPPLSATCRVSRRMGNDPYLPPYTLAGADEVAVDYSTSPHPFRVDGVDPLPSSNSSAFCMYDPSDYQHLMHVTRAVTAGDASAPTVAGAPP